MSYILNYGGLATGASLTLPDHFRQDGLGSLGQEYSFVKSPGAPGGFNSKDRQLADRTITLKADYGADSADDSMNFFSQLQAFLDNARTQAEGLRLYCRADRFFWVDSVQNRHGFTPYFRREISEYQLDFRLVDPRCYEDPETVVSQAITGAEVTPEEIDVASLQGDTEAWPVIRITPAEGVSCASAVMSWTNERGETGSFTYANISLVGDASGHTWAEIDCATGAVSFTTDDGVTLYNSAPYFSGTFPVILRDGLADAMTYQGGDATIAITARRAYYA